MWGISSHSDELTGDFGNKPEAKLIADQGPSCLRAEKLSLRDLRLLQHNPPNSDQKYFDAANHVMTTLTRSNALPDLPTVANFVPGYEASSWYGIGTPKNTAPEIITKLNTEVNAILANPKMKARLAALGGTEIPGSPADFGKLVAEET